MTEKVTKEAIQKLDAKLECSICLDTFKQPKLLPCYHVFCKSPCLKKLVARDGHSLTCPTCRHIVPLTEKGVAGLQSDFHMEHLYEIREAFNKAAHAGETKCGNCDKGVATGYCNECEDFLCDNCQEAHKVLKLTRYHRMVTLQEFQDQATTLIREKKKFSSCEKHDRNPLKIYCETCKQLICSDCTIRLHRDHNYDLLADVFPKHKEELVSSLEPLKQKLDKVMQALKMFDTRAKEINDQRATLEADIHKEIDQIHQLLDQRRVELVGELDMLTQQKLKSLAAQRDQVESTQVKLTSCLEYAEGGLQTGTEGEILTMKTPVLNRIEQISAEFDPNTIQPKTEASLNLSTDAKEQLHKMTQSFVYMTDTNLHVQVSSAVVAGVETGDTVKLEFLLRSKTAQVYEEIVTAEATNCRTGTPVKCKFVKNENKQEITYQPKQRGRHELRLSVNGMPVKGSPFAVTVMPPPQQLGKPSKVIQGLNWPWGVTRNRKGQWIVVERKGHHLTLYQDDSKFTKLEEIGTEGAGAKQFDAPAGVAVDNYDNVYVVECGNHRISKLSATFKFLSTAGTKGVGQLQFTEPCGIGFNKTNGKLYVCDQCNHRVQVLNTDLSFYNCFGSVGSEHGEFKSPTGVAFDKAGNVYIADFNNHRIQVFDSEGKFVRQLGKQGTGPGELNRPLGVAVSATGFVFVAEKTVSRISIFKTNGDFVRSFGENGSKRGQFNAPAGIAIDDDANIVITDRENGRIQVF